MAQKRHVLPLSLDDELIADIIYTCSTGKSKISETAKKRLPVDISKAVEEILRIAIPSRKQPLSTKQY